MNASGNISVGNHVISAGSPLAAQRVTVRLGGPVAHVLVNGTIVRTVACPVPQPARYRLRGARAGTAEPPRLPDPLTVKRRASVRGAIMIGGQRIQVGLPHAGQDRGDHRAGRHLPDHRGGRHQHHRGLQDQPRHPAA